MKYLLFVLVLYSITIANAQPQEKPLSSHQWRALSFESDLQINLHHFLIELVRDADFFKQVMSNHQLVEKDRQVLNKSLDVYRSKLTGRHILFDRGEIPMLTSLVLAGKTIPNDTEIGAALNASAPVFERIFWPPYHAHNNAWIASLYPKLNKYGDSISAKLDKLLKTPLFTPRGHLVQVVYKPGTRQGAYTSSRSKMSVINSTEEDSANWYALEMVFHELSHANSFSRRSIIRQLIAETFNAKGLEEHVRIWHPILFFTVGEVVKMEIADENPDFRPYADLNTLYKGSWAYRPLLEQYWMPYMQGKVSLHQAIDDMASALQAKQE